MSNVAQFYSSLSKRHPNNLKIKDRDKERQVVYKKPIDPTRREAATKKRKQELMRQLGTILRQVM